MPFGRYICGPKRHVVSDWVITPKGRANFGIECPAKTCRCI